MSEPELVEIKKEYVASDNTRRRIVVSGLIYTWAIILWVVLYGSPTNSLHESALAWSFVANLAIMFAYSFGTLLTGALGKYFNK